MQQVFSKEQIAVVTNTVSDIVSAIEKGKNLDAHIVRLTLLIPTIDAAIAEKELYGEDTTGLEDLKHLFISLIQKAAALHKQQSVAN